MEPGVVLVEAEEATDDVAEGINVLGVVMAVSATDWVPEMLMAIGSKVKGTGKSLR